MNIHNDEADKHVCENEMTQKYEKNSVETTPSDVEGIKFSLEIGPSFYLLYIQQATVHIDTYTKSNGICILHYVHCISKRFTFWIN